jgi:hypothetical protein
MSREWGATGVFESFPPRLSDDSKEYILALVVRCGATLQDRERFVGEIAEAIGRYDAHANERNRSKPSAVKANLKRAIEAASTLLAALHNLDGNSRMLLREVGMKRMQTYQRQTARMFRALSEAYNRAGEYPRSRLMEHHRLFLAADVADAMRRHLKIEPTLTREGLYEAMLEIVLKDATGKAVNATHGLARRALQKVVKWEVEGGPTGYDFVE